MNAIDLIKLNAADDLAGLIEENQNAAPELKLAPAFTIKGTSFVTCIRKTYPEGGFKPLGGGVALGSSDFENKTVNVFNYANPMQEKKDRAQGYRRGAAAWLALASSGAMNGAALLLGRAFYYGARAFGGGADAHPGLIDLYDVTNKTVDATGTTAATGSSAWFIKWGSQDDGNISYVFGNDRTLTMREWLLQQIQTNPGETPAKYADAYTNELSCAPGIQLNNIHAACRIKKLTEDSGKGLTDTLGYQAIAKFPVGFKPDVCLVTRRSVLQLRTSRAATTGVLPDAVPWPTSIAGVPIVETDSISNTEALTL